MFLKTEQFEYNGVSVMLSELSALQRIEHLALLKRRAEEAEASGNLQVSVEDLVRTGAFLVAMSLWHNHPEKVQLLSMNEAVMQIEQDVLTTWPADAIARAEEVVLRLSGMSGAVHANTDSTEVAKNNTLTDDDFSAGKSSTAS
ncbi:phage tail assembly chaperone G [Escherichia coli]|uniref:phage tail assembly chaperone G n=2 Tax=Escherichia coli TaxID=562 RepID=UPI0011C8BADC|nr:phage minor tail protein G [Escherichia coli]TXQ89867.1 phage minor tail protein G [Escherichia coli]TXR12979.1 phage minor tail protein G [Escherichia coli]